MSAGQTPGVPVEMSPAQWAMVSYDTGPDNVRATYDNKTITWNTGTTANSGSSQPSSQTLTVPAGVLTGDLLVLVIDLNGNNANTNPVVTAASGHTWTQLGSQVTQGPVSGAYNTMGIYTRVAASGDAGDTLTLAGANGLTVFIAGALGAYTNAASAGTPQTATSAGNANSIAAPSLTTAHTGGVAVFAGTGGVNAAGASSVSGSAASPYVFSREATSTGGNMAVLADSCQWWPSSTAQGGSGVTFSSPTTQFCVATFELIPVAGYDGSSAPTLTANSNGTLSVDGGSPAVSDRVAVVQNYGNNIPATQGYPSGIYTVTSVGSAGSKWVMTRASDMATSADCGQYWTCSIQYGTSFGSGGSARVVNIYPGLPAVAQLSFQAGLLPVGGMPYVMGISSVGIATQACFSNAYGESTVAVGSSSAAYGTQGSATVSNTLALGNSSVANGGIAIGNYSVVNGGDGVTIGRYAYVNADSGIAVGGYTSAYTPNMTALTSGQIAATGDTQHAVVAFAGQTTSNTPTAITPQDGAFQFLSRLGVNDWKRTCLLRLYATARRTDTPGTDSAWSAQGIVRGNGSNTYTWVGGAAPAFSVIAQDAGAAPWAVAVAISSNGLTVTVTGATGATVNWNVTAELYEAVG